MTSPVRAILDYGTNSLKLVVLRSGKTLDVLLDTERITRLGQNIVKDGRLADEDVARILEATEQLLGEAQDYAPASIDAYGTAALRQCSNRELLTAPLQEKYGLHLRILSGIEEAAAGYLGVRSGVPEADYLATLDLGGGSTELTLGREALPEQVVSLPFGARELLKRVPISDPPAYDEIEAIRREVRSQLSAVSLLPTGTTLVLIGGAATTLAGYARHFWQAKGDPVAETLTPEALDLLTMKLGRMTQAERRALPGSLKADRSDVIVHGVVALRELLGALGVDTAWVSLRSLPHGLLEAERRGIHLDLEAPVIALPAADFPPFTRKRRPGEVVFVLRRPDGRIWLQTKDRYANNVYRVPGGGVKTGEDPREAVLREIEEETGFSSVRPLPLAHLLYTEADNERIDFFSDLYLVDLPDTREPVPEDEDEGISGWEARSPEEFGDAIVALEELEDSLRPWGYFRAATLRYLRKRTREGRI